MNNPEATIEIKRGDRQPTTDRHRNKTETEIETGIGSKQERGKARN